ncbi:MAG: hypothetical protein ABIT36_04935 [Steroidobacteraceae bacterium]
MLLHVLVVAHVVVLGYWLGSELVINNTFRYVSYSGDMPFTERNRLMEHVMDTDQHVRYALVLQTALGFTLATLLGYVPGGTTAAWVIAVAAVAWLTFVEITHRVRHNITGKRFATLDRLSRYMLMAILLSLALGLIGSGWNMALWLRLKLGLFAGVMACGVGIRLALISYFRTWAVMARESPDAETNAIIRKTYWQATMVLIALWIFIAAMVAASVWKPT